MTINFSTGIIERMLYEVSTFTGSVDPETVPDEYISRNYENLVKFGQMAMKENYKTAEIQEAAKNFFQKFGFRFQY